MADRLRDLSACRTARRRRRPVRGVVGTNVIITLTLLSLITAIGVGPTMWLSALFNVAAWLFVFFRMPDLTGKSLEEIESRLSQGRFRPKDFARESR